jgi:DNA mismatch endonuclease (patch repair protein)
MTKQTDHVSQETRSAIMRAVKSEHVRSTEGRLRAAMISKGINGWQMHAENLPGKPDFVFLREKLAIFVDGCFWHGCPKCYRRPRSNRKYWDKKAVNNISRDRRNRKNLSRIGWHIMRIWEHEILASPAQICFNINKKLRFLQKKK